MYSFRLAKNTMCVFIPEVLEAIVQEYADEVLPPVINPEQWEQIAAGAHPADAAWPGLTCSSALPLSLAL